MRLEPSIIQESTASKGKSFGIDRTRETELVTNYHKALEADAEAQYNEAGDDGEFNAYRVYQIALSEGATLNEQLFLLTVAGETVKAFEMEIERSAKIQGLITSMFEDL